MNNGFCSFLKDAQNKGDLKFQENHRLSSVSSIGIGGDARFYITPYTVQALTDTVRAAVSGGVRFYVVGNCTNIIFPDKGFGGAIISTKMLKDISLKDGMIYAECGVTLPTLSSFALDHGLSGFEGLVSIPATVGGALITNAGAYGCETADRLVSFSVYLPREDRVEIRTPKTHPFSYRQSHAADGDAVILFALFSAECGDRNDISRKMAENREKRKESQPIGVKSVGSFFKKPDYVTENRSVSGKYYGKSAGELIDLCGLKGKRVGGAAVSEKHAGFIVNLENATAEDVFALAETVRQAVYEKTGVRLSEECIKIF